MSQFDPRPFASDVETGGYWRPKAHLGQVHAAICSGDTRTLTTEYGTVEAAVVDTMLVWGGSLTGDPAHRFDDVLILQKFLAGQCRNRGLAVGRLLQPDRRYEFEQLHHSEWDQVSRWLAENVDGKTGDVSWPAGDDSDPFVPPDEAPF